MTAETCNVSSRKVSQQKENSVCLACSLARHRPFKRAIIKGENTFIKWVVWQQELRSLSKAVGGITLSELCVVFFLRPLRSPEISFILSSLSATSSKNAAVIFPRPEASLLPPTLNATEEPNLSEASHCACNGDKLPFSLSNLQPQSQVNQQNLDFKWLLTY